MTQKAILNKKIARASGQYVIIVPKVLIESKVLNYGEEYELIIKEKKKNVVFWFRTHDNAFIYKNYPLLQGCQV